MECRGRPVLLTLKMSYRGPRASAGLGKLHRIDRRSPRHLRLVPGNHPKIQKTKTTMARLLGKRNKPNASRVVMRMPKITCAP
jgi:hypothetical protein